MTFRENNKKMLDLIQDAPNQFVASVYNLATGMREGQQDIKDCVTKLLSVKDAENAYYCSFSNQYIDLFLNVYSRVNTALNDILAKCAANTTCKICAMTKEEFAALNVDEIGIKSVTIPNGIWNLITPNGLANVANIMLNFNYYPSYARLRFKWWDFPEKFYYDKNHGGVDYGDLYLRRPEWRDPSGFFPPYHEEIDAFGPYTYNPDFTTSSSYSDLLSSLANMYQRPEYGQSITGDVLWAEWPEWNDPLTGKIFWLGRAKSTYPHKDSTEFINTIDSEALKLTFLHAGSTKSGWAYGEQEVRSTQFGAINKTATITNLLGSICESQYGDDPLPVRKTIYNKDIDDPSFGCFYDRCEKFLLMSFTKTADLQTATVPIDNSHLVTYDFTDLLHGKFGIDGADKSLDDQLHGYAKSDMAVGKARVILNWLKEQTATLPDTTKIIQTVKSYDALVQLADLYSVKYTIERIMYGHIHRVTK